MRIIRTASLVLTLLLLGGHVFAYPASSQKHHWIAKNNPKHWEVDEDALIPTGINANRLRDLLNGRKVDQVILSEKQLRDIRRANEFDIPPGIQKNLARGKPLPPGIRKKLSVLPPNSNRVFGVKNPNARVGVLDDDVIIFNPSSNIIIDILRDVLD